MWRRAVQGRKLRDIDFWTSEMSNGPQKIGYGTLAVRGEVEGMSNQASTMQTSFRASLTSIFGAHGAEMILSECGMIGSTSCGNYG